MVVVCVVGPGGPWVGVNALFCQTLLEWEVGIVGPWLVLEGLDVFETEHVVMRVGVVVGVAVRRSVVWCGLWRL